MKHESLDGLLPSPRVTEPTRRAIRERLGRDPSAAPRFFAAAEFDTLAALVAALTATDGDDARLLALCVDARLAEGSGNGWRYDALPPDGEMYRETLLGLDAPTPFVDAAADERNRRVSALPPRVLEEIFAEVAEFFASRAATWEAMGYTGYADARGWTAVGLNAAKDAVGKTPLPVASAGAFPATEPPAPDEECDIVIVGTGAGGAPLLARFAQAGLSVIALEAGVFWNPAADFATDEEAQSEKIFWTDERLSAGGDPLAFGNNNSGMGVGGSTLHFTAYTPRPHPDDFRLYSDFGVGADWPLGYDDLEPYLTEAEQFLGVSGPAVYPWGGARSAGYPLAPLPLNAPAELMARGAARIGIQTSPAPNAALSGAYHREGVGWRAACTNRGFCQAGCSVGAKASMDVTYIRFALAHGARVFSESFVTTLETEAASGRVTSVVYVRDGKTYRVRARRAVFLCAGAIETPRLLLLNDIGNENGQVGKHFMAHTGWQIWAQFPELTYPHRGIPGGLISEDTHRPASVAAQSPAADFLRDGADFAGGYLLQSIGVMPVTYASQWARGEKRFGADLMDHLRGYNHVAGINILGEGLPYEHNFVELSGEVDARGLPKPRVHFTAGENENRMNRHADRVMRAIFEEAGAARETWAYNRYAHTLGTCRMGNDPRTSVVDADCRVHNRPNLYVCDNGVFASSLAVNPALTQIALALRTADRFLAAGQ